MKNFCRQAADSVGENEIKNKIIIEIILKKKKTICFNSEFWTKVKRRKYGIECKANEIEILIEIEKGNL